MVPKIKKTLNSPILNKPNVINTINYQFNFDLPSINDSIFGNEKIFQSSKRGKKRGFEDF